MSNRRGIIWTPELVEQLSELWIAGRNARQIAALLPADVTRNAVIGKAYRLGLTARAKSSPPSRPKSIPLGGAAGLQRARERAASAPPPKERKGKGEPLQGPKIRLLMSGQLTAAKPKPGAAFAPLPGSAPRPWMERTHGDCCWPVGGEGEHTLSCCEPVAAYGWCRAHLEIGRTPLTWGQKKITRMRYA